MCLFSDTLQSIKCVLLLQTIQTPAHRRVCINWNGMKDTEDVNRLSKIIVSTFLCSECMRRQDLQPRIIFGHCGCSISFLCPNWKAKFLISEWWNQYHIRKRQKLVSVGNQILYFAACSWPTMCINTFSTHTN